mmetsp:Transcript_46203/g.145389  ORF Transcript_46203/g.145389 Transcript_46203/m.145389 type:complete len:85 (+) Transcript_46203:452-706(+)
MPQTNSHCLGFGDRFRLIAYLLRAAAHHRRVLLVDWASPHDLSLFFSPPPLLGASSAPAGRGAGRRGGTAIDWRITRAEAPDPL